ncbi:DUF4265 domain-containing protein [Ammonicoccus fulvus]|uniref:DUF4265 domain-containing protein n=1 Tax=Ammonicoccus fulvus TaxID=3138240 RepID=UPI003CC7F17F
MCQTDAVEPKSHSDADAQIVFDLEVDDGWPPVGSERVWAQHLEDDLYRICNPPWFVPELAVGDVVRAQAPDGDSHPAFVEVVEPGDNATIRLICFSRGPLQGDLARAPAPFTALGIYGEGRRISACSPSMFRRTRRSARSSRRCAEAETGVRSRGASRGRDGQAVQRNHQSASGVHRGAAALLRRHGCA